MNEQSSFINMHGTTRWVEADIVNRTEAMVREHFSQQAETILNRKTAGAVMGAYTLTEEDNQEIGRFLQVTTTAQLAGIAARADWAKLEAIMAAEDALRLLQHIDPEDESQEEERERLQAIVDGLDEESFALLQERQAILYPDEEDPE